MNRFAVQFRRFIETASRKNRHLCDITWSTPVGSRNHLVSSLHTSQQCLRRSKAELSSEPTKFTSSAANTRTMPAIPESVNPYQPIIVSVSCFVFLIYFLLLREENDLDEALNVGLFERVPQLEEPHLMQAIPRMKDAGIDTREAEIRLKELREQRLALEKQG